MLGHKMVLSKACMCINNETSGLMWIMAWVNIAMGGLDVLG